MSGVANRFFQKGLKCLGFLKLSIIIDGINLSFNVFDGPVFDHWESSIKLGGKRDGIREGTNIDTQLLFGIEITDSPGDLL